MNTGINLLPWREERQRLQQRRTLIGSAVICLVALAVVTAGWWYYAGEISFQTERNKYLKGEIKKIEAQLREIDKIKQRKEELMTRMSVIYELQEDRVRVVRSLDEFVRMIPEGVFFVSLDRSREGFMLEGIAQSNSQVSDLMVRLNESESFSDSNLEMINTGSSAETNTETSRFELRVTHRRTNPESKVSRSGTD
ncbi:MAG TPA: PilN domain-containing protein [Arenicellales bacterium]|jgi:type IV pilus assembly protein PilN|nr:pilus assembly protein PilN [Acidiferrobacteraceae bacterium]MDP7221240.1 PilN domain-containing protein [Arenicellales bacterium]HCF74276.1 pilus assembly protein PilN [Gammaproteobacteria bacterium]HJP11725.1 PilN domain-containing protein [Arenicellales bacterium]|tara:strand:+ start:2415 stop:3002 length:588 start_codon:yes stop_codon:yes gene_type:complete